MVYFCQAYTVSPPFKYRDQSSQTYFLLKDTVEYEDKHSLEGVEHCEEVRHYSSLLVDVQQTERPRQSKQTQESKSPEHPGPENRQDNVNGHDCHA